MGTGAALGYGAAGVVRARRRTALFLAGLSLAVATLATPSIAVDSEIQALVARFVGSIPYDFHAVGRWESPDAVAAAASSVDGVQGAEPFVAPESGTFFAGRDVGNGSGTGLSAVGIVFVRPSFARFSGRFGLAGSFDLPIGEVAITDRVALRAGLGPGDVVTVWHPDTVCTENPFQCLPVNWTASYTVREVVATEASTGGAPPFRLPLGGPWPRDVLFASLDTISAMGMDLELAIQAPPRYAVLVWADRGRLIDPYEPTGTQTRVLHLKRVIEAAIQPIETLVVAEATDPGSGARVSDVVRVVNDGTLAQRGLFVVLSAPAVTLAFLLARVNFQVGLGRRRREIGILRSRGWSPRQVVIAFLAEAALVGLVAALVGLSVGFVVSQMFLGVSSGPDPGDASAWIGEVRLTASSMGIALGAGIGLAILVAMPAVRRASGLRIVRALHQMNSLETSVEFREAQTFFLIALGGTGIVGVLGFVGISGEGGFLTFLFGASLAALILLAPVLLILGVARLVTLGTDAPYRVFARLVRPWTRDLHDLVAEGLRRQPRRSSNLAVLIAFGVAFAMFVVSLAGIIEQGELRVARTAVGGDLFFESLNVGRPDLESFAGTPGVAGLAVVDFVPSNVATIIALNATDYLGVVPWVDGYYFSEGGPDAFGEFPRGGAIANGRLAGALGLHVGDPIVLNVFSGRFVFALPVWVAAIATSLPGLQPSGASTDLDPGIFVDFDLLRAAAGTANVPFTAPGRRALLRTEDGTDPHELAKALEARWSGRSVVLEDLLASTRSDPFRNAFFGLLFTQASLAVLILVAAVTLSTYSSGIEREGEFATIAARGLGARGLVALLFGEGLSVSLVGTLVAVPTVLVFLWAFVRFEDIATPQSLALEFAIGWPAWALLGAALASATGGTLLAGLRLRRMNLPAILKLRGM